MIALTADDSTLLKDMRRFIEPVEVYDTSGKLLGLFVPANLERAKELHAHACENINIAEIEQRKQTEPSYPFDEVRHRLQMLEAEVSRRKAAGESPLSDDEAVEFIDHLRG